MPSRRPCLTAVLRMAGLRPTRQRVALAELLLGGPHRHVSAEQAARARGRDPDRPRLLRKVTETL
jgi:Fe2+ or Zn2+ uptake regulation protein